jgi:hypothetical protein
MSDTPSAADRPSDDVQFTMSEDGRTLEVKRNTKNGVLATTTHRGFAPTPGLVYKAIHGTTRLRELEPG